MSGEKKNQQVENLHVRLTVAALDRLIGGDKEMEMILSNQAVQSVISTRMQSVVERVKKVVEEAIGSSFGKNNRPGQSGSWENTFAISPPARQAIESFVNVEVECKVKEYLNSPKFKEVIDRRITDSIERESVKVVEEAVKAQVEETMKKVIEAAKEAVNLPAIATPETRYIDPLHPEDDDVILCLDDE